MKIRNSYTAVVSSPDVDDQVFEIRILDLIPKHIAPPQEVRARSQHAQKSIAFGFSVRRGFRELGEEQRMVVEPVDVELDCLRVVVLVSKVD